MTDKQIIIDGVDVSECPYYIHKDGSCSSHDCECVKCVHNVCFYKDYKRKEQECEELKKWLPIVARLEEQFKSHEKAKGIDYKTYAEQVFTELGQLKAENDEFKKKCNIYTCGICGNKEDCNKLYKTLTEIKEIAEHCIKQDICTTCDNSEQCHIEDEEVPTYDVCKLILQKISEVEDG